MRMIMILKGMFHWKMQPFIILETTIVFRSNDSTIFKEP